jgi:uncharacterized protein (UPF0297 family)
MKYLKSKKVFENLSYNIDDIKETIEDILLPISDKGYNITVTHNEYSPPKSMSTDTTRGFTSIVIKVVDRIDTPLKVTDEIKDEFIRMKDYLESEGFNPIKVIMKVYTVDHFMTDRKVDFSKFISIEDGIFTNLVFVAAKWYE